MVRIRAFQARGPGSIPGRRTFYFLHTYILKWSCGVMASTVDSESTDPGSNPGRTSSFFIFLSVSQSIGQSARSITMFTSSCGAMDSALDF